jgi:hypothetical protein
LFARLPELPLEYVISLVWSLGICVSAFSLELPAEHKLRLLATLNALLDRELGLPGFAYPNIPSLVFSITCFFDPQQDMNQLVTETVERLSKVYCKVY